MKQHLLTLLMLAMAFFVVAAAQATGGHGGGSGGSCSRIKICHFPPSDPDNFHTIRIPSNKWARHERHGDLLGSCQASCEDICSDDNPCTQDVEANTDGCVCLPEPVPVSCDDGVTCTADSCDPTDGSCVYENTCEDDNPCTADVCSSGECTFPPVSGCIFAAVVDGTACDDGDPATTGDQCVNGTCGGELDLCLGVVCDDGNSCTTDSCDPVDGSCLAEPANEGLDCVDDLGADGVCTEGTCVPNDPPPSICNCGIDPATGLTDTGWSDDLFGLGSSPAGSLWDEAASGGWGSGIVSCSDDGTTVQVVRSDPEAGVTETVGVNASQCYGFDNGDIDGVLAIDSTAAELCRLSLLEGPCAGGGGPTCGDGVCEAGEDTVSCPQDCDAGPVCGNGVCEAGEDFTTCFADCGF